MRVVVQRCKRAEVTAHNQTIGRIEKGLMLLVGITQEDTEQDAKYLADKVAGLRIFEDETGKMNLSVMETGEPYYPCHNLRFMGIVAKVSGRTSCQRHDPSKRSRCIIISMRCSGNRAYRLKPGLSVK